MLLTMTLLATSTVLSADPPDKIAAGLSSTRQLLKLMDTDGNGKVSKQEFMAFMESEFDRLDTNKDGELDLKELDGLRIRPSGVHR
jgi:hypothetical protein